MRNGWRGQRIAVVAGAGAVVAAAVGFVVWGLGGDDGAEGGPGTSATDGGESGEAEPTAAAGPPEASEVLAASGAFLDAWAAGDPAAAARLTDEPEAARAALAGLSEEAAAAGVTLTPGAPRGTTVPFAVSTEVVFEEARGELDWESELTVVRDADTGEPVVDWEPAVLHPDLAEGMSLHTGPVNEAPPVEVLGSDGAVLDVERFPSLAPMVTQLRERYGEQAGGSAGVETRIVDAEGERVAQLLELVAPSPGQVPTTIDPAVQRAAEDAVAAAGGPRASVVAIQPSTGAVRAVANHPADGFDTAFLGSYAPGSTFKIVTSSLLIERGLAAPDEPHPCPKHFEHGGWPFHNDNMFEISGGTFADSFAASCNTAFISQAPQLADAELGDHARDVFGLGLVWETGVISLDGSVPTQSDAQMAASLIGQGGVRMNPLNMASVSATVRNGSFRQPYLVPPEFDGRQLAQAAEDLAAAEELRALMSRTAHTGTAAVAMAGLGGDIGAKTGSAEVDGQDKPNAWFTAYRDDLAAAAVVPDIGHGGEFAGPVVADVLRAAG